MYLLGVDGGGSGCRVALADATGRVIATATGGMANIATDRDAALRNILAGATTAIDAGGVPVPPDRTVAALGLAGANVVRHAEWVAARLPFARSTVVSDARIALAGAHGGADGIVAIVGTGSAFAAQRNGAVTTAGGWGFALGDEAGGASLGRAAMRMALHAVDGLAPMTPLLGSILEAEGGPETLAAQSMQARPDAFARHARAVVAAASDGDPAADAILSEAADYVARAIDRLMEDGPLPIAFHGGLADVYVRRLAPRFGALIRPPRGTALDGALTLALALLEAAAENRT